MWIFKTLLISITEPKKYKILINLPTKKILSYFVAWMTILGVGLGIYAQFSEVPKFKNTLSDRKELLVESYPTDLIINWDKERLTVAPENYNEIKFDQTFDNESKLFFEYQNKEIKIEDFPTTNNVKILVDQTKLYTPNPEGWTDLELNELPYFDQEFEVNNENISQLAETGYNNTINFIDENIPLIYVSFILIMIISRVIVSLFYSLMVFLLGKLVKFPKTWKQSWHLSMLVIVLAEMINQITNLTYTTLDIPMFSLSFWVITSYIFFVNLKKPSIKVK